MYFNKLVPTNLLLFGQIVDNRLFFDWNSLPIVISLPVSYRTGETILTATTLNLSKGGIALRTLNPLDQATKTFLQFRLPGTSHNIDAEARVAWSDRRGSMGLQFEKISPADRYEIGFYIH